jgi:hypothetical protein
LEKTLRQVSAARRGNKEGKSGILKFSVSRGPRLSTNSRFLH